MERENRSSTQNGTERYKKKEQERNNLAEGPRARTI